MCKNVQAAISIDYQRVARALSPAPGTFELQFNLGALGAHGIDKDAVKQKFNECFKRKVDDTPWEG